MAFEGLGLIAPAPLINPIDRIVYDSPELARQHIPPGGEKTPAGAWALYQRYVQIYGGSNPDPHMRQRLVPVSIDIPASQAGGTLDVHTTGYKQAGTTSKASIPKWYWSRGGQKESFLSEILQPLIVFSGPIAGFIAAPVSAAAAAAEGIAPAVAAPVVAAGGGAGAGAGIISTAVGVAETVAPYVGTALTAAETGQKILQSKSAQKQAKQQAAEAEQAAQQAQKVQAIQQEVQQAVDTGQPITQDLVNRAAALGIKISSTDGKITTSTMIPSGKLPYVIGAGAFLIVMYFLFADRRRRH